MATYNGASYLDEQLTSIHDQTLTQIDITISDDDSSDDSLEILQSWQKKWTKGQFKVIRGPCQGFAENFRALINHHSDRHKYVAFADQDDVWDKDKLEIALDRIERHSQQPALYCGRTRFVDEKRNFLGLSAKFERPPHISNALVQSIAGANTMVLNRSAAATLRLATHAHKFVAHDWFCYIIVSSCGGHVIYDPEPHMDYRQHAHNLIGANDGFRQRLKRIEGMLRGQLKIWTAINLRALQVVEQHFTIDAQQSVQQLRDVHTGNLLKRLSIIFNRKLFRQTRLGDYALVFAILFNKV